MSAVGLLAATVLYIDGISWRRVVQDHRPNCWRNAKSTRAGSIGSPSPGPTRPQAEMMRSLGVDR